MVNRRGRHRLPFSLVVGSLILLVAGTAAIAGPMLSPYSSTAMVPVDKLLPIGSPGHPLGTDQVGRDMLTRLMAGGQVSILLGIAPVALSLPLGLVLGLTAGYYGGWRDEILTRLLDIMFAFPTILLAIAIVAALGPGIFNAILAIAAAEVPTMARVVRAPVLSLREQEFVLAARAVGATDLRILTRHITLNVLSSLVVYAAIQLGGVIIFGSALSFLGLGAQPPQAEWGLMLAEGRNVIAVAPWVITFPGLAIMFVVSGFAFLGDGLRDFLDPRVWA